MRPGKCSKDQLSHIGLPLPYLHLGDALIYAPDLVDIGEVQAGVDPLSVHVHGQGDHIHVAGPLSVSKQGRLHTLSPGQQAHLRRGYTLPSIIVGVQGDNGTVSGRQMLDEVLDLVGKIV